MALEMEQSVTIAPSARRVDLPEKTGSRKSENYLGPPTGEGILVDRVAIDQSPKIARRPAAGKNGQAKALPSSDQRRAFRRHWIESQAAAEAMLQAAEMKDLMAVGLAADNLEQSLAELWKLRE